MGIEKVLKRGEGEIGKDIGGVSGSQVDRLQEVVNRSLAWAGGFPAPALYLKSKPLPKVILGGSTL